MAEEKFEESSNLDSRIEDLLDSPDEVDTPEVSQEASEMTEPAGHPDSDQSEPDDIKEATSWVQILEPETDSPEHHICVWGRFWGQIEDIASTFYLLLDPDGPSLSTRRLVVFGNSSPLADYHPRMESSDFEHRLIESGMKDEAVPTVIYELVEEGFDEFFDDEQMLELIFGIVEEQREPAFEQWLRELVDKIIDQGGFEVQARAQVVPTPEENGGDYSETSSHQVSEGTSEQSDSDSDFLSVSILTSPTSGISVEEITEGMEIFVRIVDSRAKHLPENLLDPDRSPPASIPIKATVSDINEPEELPERIKEGDPGDYRQITVDLEQTVPGQGLVYLEDRIKQEQDQTDEENVDFESMPFLLMLAVLLLFVILIISIF